MMETQIGKRAHGPSYGGISNNDGGGPSQAQDEEGDCPRIMLEGDEEEERSTGGDENSFRPPYMSPVKHKPRPHSSSHNIASPVSKAGGMHESVAGKCVSVDESSVVVSKDERGVKRDARGDEVLGGREGMLRDQYMDQAITTGLDAAVTQDGGLPFKPGGRLPPGWAVCYHPKGCNGRRRLPKTQDFFSRKMLKGNNKGGSKNRSCLRCGEIGKSAAQLAHNKKQRTRVKAGTSFERRHKDPANRAKALNVMAMFEQLEGEELLLWVAENPFCMHAFSEHVNSLCTNRGFVDFEAVLVQLMSLWSGGITGKSDLPAPRILNLGCGWTTDDFDAAAAVAAAAAGSDQQVEVCHLDLFDYKADGRVVTADMYQLHEAVMGQEFDIIVIIDSIFSGRKADELVGQLHDALSPGGVAGIYQVDGYLGEATLAIGRAAQCTGGLRVIAFEEGQRDAAAANAAAEADAVEGRAVVGMGSEGQSSASSSASVTPPSEPAAWRALMRQPVRVTEQPWGLNYVVLNKPTEASPAPVPLPCRALRLPCSNGSHAEYFVIYTIGLPDHAGGPMRYYHGQAMQRIGQRDGFVTAMKRLKEHVKLLQDEEKTHDSPQLQLLYDAHDGPEIPFHSSPIASNDPTNPWGHAFGGQSFAYTIYDREEYETYGGVCERAMRTEQMLIDQDPHRLNACPIASAVSFEISSAGGDKAVAEGKCFGGALGADASAAGAAPRIDHPPDSDDVDLSFYLPDGTWKDCGVSTLQRGKGVGSIEAGAELGKMSNKQAGTNFAGAALGRTTSQLAKDLRSSTKVPPDYIPKIKVKPVDHSRVDIAGQWQFTGRGRSGWERIG